MTGAVGPASDEERSDAERLSEKLLDVFVFVPTGIVVSLAEELPRLAARGRERLGVHVSSARAVGEFAVRVGGNEIRRISGRVAPPPPAGLGRRRPSPSRRAPAAGIRRGGRAGTGARVGHRRPHHPDRRAASRHDRHYGEPANGPEPPRRAAAPRANGNVPPVSTLSIPGFDTLSASQVVQRLDGLSREELVSVRAYETSTRGRRTILNRVDQLLEERA